MGVKERLPGKVKSEPKLQKREHMGALGEEGSGTERKAMRKPGAARQGYRRHVRFYLFNTPSPRKHV